MLNIRKKYYTKNLKIIFYLFLLFFLYFFYKNISSSVFLKKKDKINVVFYGKESFYLSFSKTTNYLIKTSADTRVLVPGGYGYYRVGALGKLVYLEKKPEIIKKTFSGATSSFVDLYFYSTNKIYYSNNESNLFFPKVSSVFFSLSNANFVDRLILFFKIINKKESDFKLIKINDKFFNQEEFNKKYQGIFYKKIYREKMPSVQIIYDQSYLTAYFLSQIINGEGIRVVDISKNSKLKNQNLKQDNNYNCFIVENKDKPTVVAFDLMRFFDCRFVKGETEISDIIFVLGSLEKDWAVK